jgi:predicted CopG family antitoxin
MPRRTITIELDAYERLRSTKRPGESFSDVVLRAVLLGSPPTGAELLAYYRGGGSGVSEAYLETVERTADSDHDADNLY